MGGISVYNEWD